MRTDHATCVTQCQLGSRSGCRSNNLGTQIQRPVEIKLNPERGRELEERKLEQLACPDGGKSNRPLLSWWVPQWIMSPNHPTSSKMTLELHKPPRSSNLPFIVIPSGLRWQAVASVPQNSRSTSSCTKWKRTTCDVHRHAGNRWHIFGYTGVVHPKRSATFFNLHPFPSLQEFRP